MLSREQLQRAAAGSGFQIESYEKVHVLVRLLEAVRADCRLCKRVLTYGREPNASWSEALLPAPTQKSSSFRPRVRGRI